MTSEQMLQLAQILPLHISAYINARYASLIDSTGGYIAQMHSTEAQYDSPIQAIQYHEDNKNDISADLPVNASNDEGTPMGFINLEPATPELLSRYT